VSDCEPLSFMGKGPHDWAHDRLCVKFKRDDHTGSKKQCEEENAFMCEVPDSMFSCKLTLWITILNVFI